MQKPKSKTVIVVAAIILVLAGLWVVNQKVGFLQKIKTPSAVQKLYSTYKDGIISQCSYNGGTVYSAGLNAYDAGGIVADQNGNTIDVIGGSDGKSQNGIAPSVTGCTHVYVVSPNIWGLPAVNTYNLK